MIGIVAWAQPAQAELLRGIVESVSVRLDAVAAPTPEQTTELAKAMRVSPEPDLRRLMQTTAPPVLLLLADEPPHPSIDQLAAEAGTRVVSVEPRPRNEVPGGPPVLDFAPRFRGNPGFLAALDVLPDFGVCDCLSIVALGAAGEGTLAARLFDAMHMLDYCVSEVDVIAGSLARPPLTPVPDAVGRLRGSLTANIRLPERRCASIIASDRAGRWERRLTLLGERGTLQITDGGFRWHEDGQVVEEHREDGPWDCAALLAWQLRRLLDREDTTDPPADRPRLLALCEATRLSCRTGDGESPRRMMEMLRKEGLGV